MNLPVFNLRNQPILKMTRNPSVSWVSRILVSSNLMSVLSLVHTRLVSQSPVSASYWLTLDLWLAKDNRFLNPKSSYERILTAPPCRLTRKNIETLTKTMPKLEPRKVTEAPEGTKKDKVNFMKNSFSLVFLWAFLCYILRNPLKNPGQDKRSS